MTAIWELQATCWIAVGSYIHLQHIEDRHYASACAEHFSSVARQWDIFEKVTTFGTDNARNVTSAVASLSAYALHGAYFAAVSEQSYG